MTRFRWFLIGVIAIELLAAGFYFALRMSRPIPPVPELAAADPITAEELRALAANCENASDWAKLGEAYLATGYFPEGEACLRQAHDLDRVNSDYPFKHAFALERLGMIEEASAGYETAARGHPRKGDCWFYIGRNYLRLEQAGRAAEAFERAGSLPGARYELALLQARDGRLAESDAEAARLASQFPDAYQPVSLRYRLALARKESAAADAFADQFARRPRPLPTPLSAEVSWIFGVADGFGRARLFRDAGREVEAGRLAIAESKLREAINARWNPEIADRLAQVAFSSGMREEAFRILTEAVERGGPSFELLWRLGQAEEALVRPARALELWERAARLASGSRAIGLWEDLASRYQRAGQTEKAKPFAANAHLAAGLEALAAGRADEAVKILTRAVEADSRAAHGWFALGESQRIAGQPGEARTAYDRCLNLDPDHGRAIRARKSLGE